MEEIYLPTLHWFAMNNPFTGSRGLLRFKVEPQVVMATAKEVDFHQSTLRGCFWHGLLCLEKSQIEGEATFPLTQEGREAMKAWLQSQD